MLTLIIGILVFATIVVEPLILYFSARVLRIKNVTFLRTYFCFLLLAAVGIAGFAVSLLRFPEANLFFLTLALGQLALQPMIVQWVFRTTFWRAAGCWLLCAGIVIGLAFGLRAVAIEAFVVPTGSMLPTVMPGDRFLADKITSRFRGFHRGEIVAFHPPQDSKTVHIKRIVAVVGDRIEVRNGFVYVNGAASGLCPLLPYREPGAKPLEFPCTVPPGKLFMLGDNRTNSVDSRHYGFADAQAVVGLAVIVYGSIEQPLEPYDRIVLRREGKDPDKESHPGRIRWERIGTVLK